MDEAPTAPLPRQSHLFFLLIMVGLGILLWLVFRPFVIYMVTGIFVAVLALPIDKLWERVLPNRVSAFVTMFSLFVLLALPIALLGFALANDATALATELQEGRADEWVDRGLENPLVQRGLQFAYPGNTTEQRNQTVRENVDEWQDRAIEGLKDVAADLARALPGFFIALTVILFVVYYVLVDGERLVEYLERAAPIPASQVHFLLEEARNGLNAVFAGQILTSLIQGALGGIGFLIAGVPGAIVWASVMAVLSLLPVVGAFLVWVPAAIFLLLRGDLWQGLFLIGWGVVVVSQIDNFVRPKLIGDRAAIHPIFVLIGVLGGVAAFGFIGLFLGPLIVGVAISVLKVWEKEYLHPTVGSGDVTRHAQVHPPRGERVRRARGKGTGKAAGKTAGTAATKPRGKTAGKAAGRSRGKAAAHEPKAKKGEDDDEA